MISPCGKKSLGRALETGIHQASIRTSCVEHGAYSRLIVPRICSYTLFSYPYSTLCLCLPSLDALRRIKKAILKQPSTMDAIKLINDLRARFPTQDPNMIAWWKRQTTEVTSTIKPPPTASDLPTLMDFAKLQGLLFFSERYVLLYGWVPLLNRHVL